VASPRVLLLLVEDQPARRQALRTALGDTFALREAENSAAAARLLTAAAPDLVLLSTTLPAGQSFAVLQRLLDGYGNTRVPVCLLGGTADPPRSGLLCPPFTRDKVRRRVLALLNRRRELKDAHYREVADHAGDLVFAWDPATDTAVLSRPHVNRLGAAGPLDRVSRRLERSGRLTAAEKQGLQTQIAALSPAQPSLIRELRLQDADGIPRWYRLFLFAHWQGTRPVYVGRLSDIHYEKTQALRWQDQARRDSLTGLLNRRSMEQAISRRITASTQTPPDFALALIDVDDFKQVNDTRGHGYGDRLLCRVAEAVGRLLGSDDIAARIGGDEFAVVLGGAGTPAAARRRTAALHDALTAALQEKHGRDVTVSIGTARCPANGDSYESLLFCADQSLYAAKQAGKNACRLYDASLGRRIRRTPSSLHDPPADT